MSILLTCGVCGTVWPAYLRDQQHAQCPGCRALYRVRIELMQAPAEPRRLVAPEQRVRVSQG